jgi:hypothetical protein
LKENKESNCDGSDDEPGDSPGGMFDVVPHLISQVRKGFEDEDTDEQSLTPSEPV